MLFPADVVHGARSHGAKSARTRRTGCLRLRTLSVAPIAFLPNTQAAFTAHSPAYVDCHRSAGLPSVMCSGSVRCSVCRTYPPHKLQHLRISERELSRVKSLSDAAHGSRSHRADSARLRRTGCLRFCTRCVAPIAFLPNPQAASGDLVSPRGRQRPVHRLVALLLWLSSLHVAEAELVKDLAAVVHVVSGLRHARQELLCLERAHWRGVLWHRCLALCSRGHCGRCRASMAAEHGVAKHGTSHRAGHRGPKGAHHACHQDDVVKACGGSAVGLVVEHAVSITVWCGAFARTWTLRLCCHRRRLRWCSGSTSWRRSRSCGHIVGTLCQYWLQCSSSGAGHLAHRGVEAAPVKSACCCVRNPCRW